MDETTVDVSVIVLTYNHEKYIRRALDSILEQKTKYSYEVLIGDDASTDGTSKIISEYAQQYPHVIKAFIRKRNLGGSKNLFDIFQHARGRYIANCEGDDYWCDNRKLQIQVDFLEKHMEFSGCTHACRIVNEAEIPLENQSIPWVCTKEYFTIQDFQGIYLPGQPATLVHRNFFLDLSHDYSIIYKANPMIADRTIILILSALGPIRRFPEIMSCYRIVSNKKEPSATTKFFSNNMNVNQMQYELTKQLEQYVGQEFGISVKFTRFKWSQKIKGIIKKLIQVCR